MTLIETLLATCILLVAFMTVLELIAVSVHHQAATEQQMQAYLIAENRLQELRADKFQPDQDTNQFPPASWTKPSTEGFFFIKTEITPVTRFTPCSSIDDSPQPTHDPALTPSAGNQTVALRRLRNSLFQARVVVTWGGQNVSVTTLIGEPERKIDRVEVTQEQGKSNTFQATAVDSSGQPIPDVMFDWWAEPSSSQPAAVALNATTNDTSEVAVHARSANTPTGQCRIVAACRYLGVERTGSVVCTVRPL